MRQPQRMAPRAMSVPPQLSSQAEAQLLLHSMESFQDVTQTFHTPDNSRTTAFTTCEPRGFETHRKMRVGNSWGQGQHFPGTAPALGAPGRTGHCRQLCEPGGLCPCPCLSFSFSLLRHRLFWTPWENPVCPLQFPDDLGELCGAGLAGAASAGCSPRTWL